MKFKYYLKKLRDIYVINQVKNVTLPNFKPSLVVRQRVVFKGRVQKVGFRLEIHELAKRLNLTGWVQNRSDKSVEAELQGETDKIAFLIKFLKSLKRAAVRDVVINEIPRIVGDNDFTLKKNDDR